MAQVANVDQILAAVEQKWGFVPNVLQEMAHSPAALQVYLNGQQAMSQSELTPGELQAVQLAVSTVNDCAYCQAAHAKGGLGAGVSAEDLEAIQAGDLPEDERLRALVEAARLLLDKRGFLGEDEVQSLAARGVSRAQLYDVIALIGLKTITNYVNHLAHTELDPQLR